MQENFISLFKHLDFHSNPKGLFTRPSLTLLVGAPGSMKTLLSLDLAVCVALGKPWLGHQTNPAPVLYVEEETGPAQFLLACKARFKLTTPLRIFRFTSSRSQASTFAQIPIAQI